MKSPSASFFRYFPVGARERKWGLFATTGGEARLAPRAVYPPEGHPKKFALPWTRGRVLDGFALVYISSGGGKFESRPGGQVDLEAGSAFLLFPGVWHRYAPDPETGWHEYWIGFDGDQARRWLKHRFISPRKPVVKVSAEDAVQAVFAHTLQSVRQHRPALQQILAGAIANLLGLFYSAQQALPAPEAAQANKIESAIARIQSDFARDVDMQALANDLGVSYSWLRAKFTDHTGLAPRQYLLELRMVRARSLLAETSLTVKEIAVQTGFGDEHYFSRIFRQRLKCTPSQWRSHFRRGAR